MTPAETHPQEPPPDSAGDAPTPTGPPSPRPDPYAQFGNPLHTSWGVEQPRRPPSPATVISAAPARRRRSGVGRLLLAVVLVGAVVGGIWLAREPLGDLLDDVLGATEGDGSGGSEPGSGSTVTSEEDTFAEVLAAREESFDAWLSDQGEQLEGTAAEIDRSASDLVGLAGTVVDGSAATAPVARSTADRLEALLLANLQVLDTAPASPTRDGFVRVRLIQLDALSSAASALDSGDLTALAAATTRLESATAETARLCRQHGDRVAALCD